MDKRRDILEDDKVVGVVVGRDVLVRRSSVLGSSGVHWSFRDREESNTAKDRASEGREEGR
jgi:hypothetical protein